MADRMILGRLTTSEGRAPVIPRTSDGLRAYAARVRAQFAPKREGDE